MSSVFAIFLDSFYWIDLLCIAMMLGMLYWMIVILAKKKLVANIAYNKALYAMRWEIYIEYEKNFFL